MARPTSSPPELKTNRAPICLAIGFVSTARSTTKLVGFLLKDSERTVNERAIRFHRFRIEDGGIDTGPNREGIDDSSVTGI
jgi:hypothetical protein